MHWKPRTSPWYPRPGRLGLATQVGSWPRWLSKRVSGLCRCQEPALPHRPSLFPALRLPSDQYMFLGFLPRRKADRSKLLTFVADMPFTLVAFEAPHRLKASLSDLLDVLGDREVAVSREMTKRHEEVFKGLLSGAIDRFSEPRGEFTLVIAGAGASNGRGDPPDDEALREEIIRLQGMGVGARDAAATIAKSTGLSRREAYRMWLDVISEKKQP